MTYNVRRVVTGHDEEGKAVVLFDDVSAHVNNRREGLTGISIWNTESIPASNSGDEDRAGVPPGLFSATGSVFRVSIYEPGVGARRHRSHHIRYCVVMSGEIDMEMDDVTVHLQAGNVLVQQSGVHNWANNGTEPCVIAFVVIPAADDGRPTIS